ncbi:CNP1-like family protein [Solemya velesiana gill symbiont]|uniref:CNP1-like uncharacterized domain-containing protein n=1 Tax=Solemya velesiana gill symbiont TaxID=1918948 RepID=A0A1T2KVI2_9GAMM|nr:CNP1-like family protein [Solemya velesiana gill symbiont]OOZ36811.1 hypothetical protein BOW51_05335 [Solemya velesiana gill symbiont]
MKRLIFIAGALSLLLAFPAMADNPFKRFMDDPNQVENPDVEEYVWKEGATDLPDYPQEENLLEFDVHAPGGKFIYFIDEKSLSVGEKDGVVRYALVIRSRTGAENVTYEGMRCNIKEFKSYAFGNGRGEWRKARKPRWMAFRGNGYNQYRYVLWEYYLCDRAKVLPRSVEEIVSALKYPTSDSNRKIFFEY